MKDESSIGRQPDQIDSPILWCFVRGAQILLTVVLAKTSYLSLGTDSFRLNLFSGAGLLLMIEVFAHRVATGSADDTGIHYRRYFRLKTVPWADVLGVQWVSSRLKILIKGRDQRKLTIVFLLSPLKSMGAYWGHRLGVEVAPPEILERIHALSLETPPAIDSSPPHSKWLLRVFLAIVAVFCFIFLWRLLSVLAVNPV